MISAIAHELQLQMNMTVDKCLRRWQLVTQRRWKCSMLMVTKVLRLFNTVQAVMDLNVGGNWRRHQCPAECRSHDQRQYAELLEQLPMIRDTLSHTQIVALIS
ncbi:hypothetical protein S101258_00099 [Lactiplantibacillus plantarum subsp. plantarum]|uniref:Uncharacterized protein n=1 Tax=Lactiplantibacillus plantarum subsp. plantarum TaxID=337330 RepID=A0A2S3UA48_LACPN|nr:hypothetical protein S101258_00099 [Lactiplantibacillus plantarum subsp. plantarum]